jgi:hypothetical protein
MDQPLLLPDRLKKRNDPIDPMIKKRFFVKRAFFYLYASLYTVQPCNTGDNISTDNHRSICKACIPPLSLQI